MYVNIVILVKYRVFIFSINICLYRKNIFKYIIYWRLNMNTYMIIRSDNKSISPPMLKHEAIMKLREYNIKSIATYLISKNKYLHNNNSDKYKIFLNIVFIGG